LREQDRRSSIVTIGSLHKVHEESTMITMQVTVEVTNDRRVVLTLPPEVPTGQTELIVSISPMLRGRKPARTSLAKWAEENGEHFGDKVRSDDVEGFTGRRF